MKIHTSLDYSQMYGLLRDSGAPISFHKLEQNGSRTHAHGYEVTLEGSGGRNNTGLYGSGEYNGATWDEWGAFFGALYYHDSEARCGGTVTNPIYANFSHFHYLTADRFQKHAGMHVPTDTHPRHQWKWDAYYIERHCTKCSAAWPRYISGRDWS